MMRNVFFIFVLVLFSFSAFSQEYSFTIDKHGEGSQILIFIPGFASSGKVWDETVQVLKEDYTCIVLTMPGFGGVKPEENPSFEKWKSEIERFIREKNLEKPIVIGHSMGGVLAMAIASDYPELLRKIVVVDALPCLAALSDPSFVSKENMDCSSMVSQIEGMKDDEFLQMQRVNIASMTTSKEKIAEILDWGMKSDRKTFAKMFCDFYNIDLRARINSITIPTLVLLEPLFKNIEDSIVSQYKGLSHVELLYADKGLHFLMYDDSDWYLENLTEFLILE